MDVLVAGESWTAQTTLLTGVDTFTFSSYTEEINAFRQALTSHGHNVTHLPSHLVPRDFPDDSAHLQGYDVVVLSDIGANSLLLSPAVYERSERRPNRLQVLSSWVRGGGSLLMVGGYLSFSGLEGKGNYPNTPIEDVLPVTCVPGDDRCEVPEGATPTVVDTIHPALEAVPTDWPHLLGWNRTNLRSEAHLLATIGSDPLIAVRDVELGRTAVFTSDFAPHWAPADFIDWTGYAQLWQGLITWLGTGRSRRPSSPR